MSWETNYLQFKTRSLLDSVGAVQQRQRAFDEFILKGLPTRKDEAWKYTSLADFKKVEWHSADESEAHLNHDQMQELSKLLPSEFYNLVFVNGILNATLSDDLGNGIEVVEIEAEDFKNSGPHTEGGLFSLAEAFLTKKIQIQIKRGQIFERPLHVVIVQSSKNSVYLSEKVEIKVGENAELTLLLHTLSFSNSTGDALNLGVSLELAESARVQLIQLQNEDLNSYHFSQVEVALNSRAQFKILAMSLGSRLTRNYLHVHFQGHHAEAEVYGLTLLDSNQHVDNYTFVQHSIGENNSIQHYKSILGGASQSIFRGRVRIEKDAQKANSSQLNNNLLLTREASANSVPQLEIYADDVKAGHGSTTGQLNKEEIFYFLSRGINQFVAVKMLSYGYAQELVYKFSDETLQNFVFKALQGKLDRMIQDV